MNMKKTCFHPFSFLAAILLTVCLCIGMAGCDQTPPATTTPTTVTAATTLPSQPTAAPTTEPSVAPPATETTAAPTTEATTAPTTAPTTEPTTAPTTAPTTEPTTERLPQPQRRLHMTTPYLHSSVSAMLQAVMETHGKKASQSEASLKTHGSFCTRTAPALSILTEHKNGSSIATMYSGTTIRFTPTLLMKTRSSAMRRITAGWSCSLSRLKKHLPPSLSQMRSIPKKSQMPLPASGSA